MIPRLICLGSAAIVTWLAGCATAPNTHIIRAHGLSLPLPGGFRDNSREVTAHAAHHAQLTAQLQRSGVFGQTLLSFESEPSNRTMGSCAISRIRLAPDHDMHALALQEIVHELARRQARQQQHTQPWDLLKQGHSLPFSPWSPAQSAQTLSSQAASLAGLPAWQHTSLVRWTHQPGHMQPVSMERLILATWPSERAAPQDRIFLQARCSAVDAEPYIRIAIDDLSGIIAGLGVENAAPMPQSNPRQTPP